ncbi:hypothetical protein D3C87_1320520 [compost metagenome]
MQMHPEVKDLGGVHGHNLVLNMMVERSNGGTVLSDHIRRKKIIMPRFLTSVITPI